MCIQPRIRSAAFACGLGLGAAGAGPARASTRAPTDRVIEITEALLDSDAYAQIDAWLLGPYAAWIANSRAAAAFHAWATTNSGTLILFGIALALGTAAIVMRRRRATGEIRLRLDFPDEVDGDFEVALHRRAGKKDSGFGRFGSSRRARTGVRRETQFDRLMPGTWFLSIEGTLHARHARTALLQVHEEIQVEVDGRDCRAIEHAFSAIETPVEFRVQWDAQRARDVGLRLADDPNTLRNASHGVIKMRLPIGRHALLIGSADRVVEQDIEISSYEPLTRTTDLASTEDLLFKGCPPAVTPFMQGRLDDAARALERDGQKDVASLLRARWHQELGHSERAAEELENAGRPAEAAELWRSIEDFDRAALLFEAAGELHKAAEMWAEACAWPEAARAFASLDDWSEAARCYEAADDTEGLISALEGQGEIFRAAALASEHGDRARSIRLLQRVPATDPEYGRAGELLALAYENEGHLDLAAAQLVRCIDQLAPGEHAPELEVHLAELFTESGEHARALGILETLRDRDPTYPRVAGLIEGLRKKLTAPPRDLQSTPFTPPPGATAFVAQDRYEILDEIGRGGMGVVYKARDRRLGRIVALKRMPENLRDHPTAVQLFLGEAQAAARMNHPNIVTLFDADQENGHFFITMEMLEGMPLNAILKQRGRFGPRDSARLALQVCAGLQFAHDQGIVHRDIKTSNLFITREKKLKIMDFGLAKILEAVRDGGATVIAGTPFFMAPEQATGNVVDGRTDLYALGVTLFELSTGRLPFTEGDVAGLHRSAPRPDPSEGLDDYPPALGQLIQQLMSISADDRPATAGLVAKTLSAIISNR